MRCLLCSLLLLLKQKILYNDIIESSQMTQNLTEQNKVFLRKEDCRVKISQIEKILKCGVTFYKNKMLEFHFNKDDIESYNFPSNISFLHSNEKIILLDLNFSVQLIQKPVVEKNPLSQQSITKFSTHLIIKEIRSEERVHIKWLQNSLTEIRQYLEECMWLQEDIEKRYEIAQEISNKDGCNRKRDFLLVKNLTSFQNRFVKKYEKKLFKSKGSKRLDITQIIKQVEFQNLLQHQNVMCFNQFMTDDQNFYLFYEQKPSKILSDHVFQRRELSSNRIKGIIEQLLAVLSELQIVQVMHNNIQLSSVFIIESNDQWKISLGEFQYAQFNDEIILTARVSKKKNSRYFLAPQIIRPSPQSIDDYTETFSDVYSLGVLFYELLFRDPDQRAKFIEERLELEPINFDAFQFKKLPFYCVDLLKQMLEDYEFRISPNQALNHSFFMKNETLSPYRSMRTHDMPNILFQSTEFDEKRRSRNKKKTELLVKKNTHRNSKTDIPRKKVNFDELKFVDQNPADRARPGFYYLKRDFNNASIEDIEMDDSHHEISLRDVRMMKPAWIIHQIEKGRL